jgi:hypothetical protein
VHIHIPYNFADWLPEEAEVDVQHANQIPKRNLFWILSTGGRLKLVCSVFQSLQPEKLIPILQETHIEFFQPSHTQKKEWKLYRLKLSWYLLSCETNLHCSDPRETFFM